MLFYDIRIFEHSSNEFFNSKVIIYGAGNRGREIAQLVRGAGIDLLYFCDSNPELWGKKIDGIVVCESPNEVAVKCRGEFESVVYIVACISHPEEAWSCFATLLHDSNIRFITYWGISQFLSKNRNELFAKNQAYIDRYQIDDSLRLNEKRHIYLGEIRNYIESKDDVWVIQPGKVGSMTVTEMLSQQNIKTIHTHNLLYPKYMLGNELKKEWDRAIQIRIEKPLKVICMVRNPLDRDYSAFWQAFTDEKPNIFSVVDSHSLQEFYDDYINNIIMDEKGKVSYGLYCPPVWNDEFIWIRDEIKGAFGIDIYRESFNKEKGYSVYGNNTIKIFLFRLENLDGIIDELGEFVGKSLEIIRSNDSSSKYYSMAFKQFKDEVRISKDYINHYFEDNFYVDFFYSKQEQKRFIDKWDKNIMC